jgi:cell fate (sporulation/competence/biofilm development) regulator YmcA (YheA/YmcA/DUF963 family)
MTQAEALSRRELKANLKIQALIDKVKRAQKQKEFYEGLAKKGSIAPQLQSILFDQN